MVSKRTLPSTPSNPPETQINPKKQRTPTSEDEDDQIVRLLMEEDTSWCIGSCNGWLFFHDNEEDAPFIVSASPSSADPTRFYLPPLETLPFLPRVYRSYIWDKSYITKAVMVGDPDSHDSFVAVVLHSDSVDSSIAYCKNEDFSWEVFPGESGILSYREIMVRGGALHALATDLVVHTWDLSGPKPVFTRTVNPPIPMGILVADYKFSFNKLYLAELSSGEFLVVVRRVGYHVKEDGLAVDEHDLLTDEDTHPSVCPYRTLKFEVYKMDSEEKKWVKVEDLGDRALFVGNNNSISLSAAESAGYEGNTIYYTDDNWEQTDEGLLYGGDDFGKFNLQLGRTEQIDNVIEDDRIVPSPV